MKVELLGKYLSYAWKRFQIFMATHQAFREGKLVVSNGRKENKRIDEGFFQFTIAS
jgi:hypothetical protein